MIKVAVHPRKRRLYRMQKNMIKRTRLFIFRQFSQNWTSLIRLGATEIIINIYRYIISAFLKGINTGKINTFEATFNTFPSF